MELSRVELSEIDLSSLERAVSRFRLALEAWDGERSNDLYRDAVIQRFEFTYELAVRTVRRYVRLFAASPDEVNEMSFKQLVQRGEDLRVIESGGVLRWLEYRQARTDTVHTYDEDRAIEVAEAALLFANEVENLLKNLEAKRGA